MSSSVLSIATSICRAAANWPSTTTSSSPYTRKLTPPFAPSPSSVSQRAVSRSRSPGDLCTVISARSVMNELISILVRTGDGSSVMTRTAYTFMNRWPG